MLMIWPAMDEMLASLQHLKRQRDAGDSLWRTFWGLSTDVSSAGSTQTAAMK
jgi:hypothetical protein